MDQRIVAGFVCLTCLACGGSDINSPAPPAPATSIALNGGDNQSAATGTAVPMPPSVKVTNADGGPVSSVAVTFAVASGGGSITGAGQTTDGQGIATVGSWTLGPVAGTNTLTASAEGLDGSPVVFTAIGTSPATKDLASVVGGVNSSCGLTSEGAAYCWGWNQFGQLGDGTTTDRVTPVPVAGGLTFRSLLAAGAHTCGVTTDGAAYCWGRNTDGELGDGTTTGRPSPGVVAGGLGFESLVGGYYHTCGLTASGTAHCWGRNINGQLGDGTQTPRLTPVPVIGGVTFQSLAGGGHHTCGLTAAGAAHCWGYALYGQLGSDIIGASIPEPVAVRGGLSFVQLTAGDSHTCGLTIDSRAYCWGYNAEGSVGDGSTVDRLSPAAVEGGLTFDTLSAGAGHTCGITDEGRVHCWGYNSHGQLGDGTTTSRPTPTAVAGGFRFESVVGGFFHTIGITTDGVTYSWGSNEKGELGDGTTTDQSTPITVTKP